MEKYASVHKLILTIPLSYSTVSLPILILTILTMGLQWQSQNPNKIIDNFENLYDLCGLISFLPGHTSGKTPWGYWGRYTPEWTSHTRIVVVTSAMKNKLEKKKITR